MPSISDLAVAKTLTSFGTDLAAPSRIDTGAFANLFTQVDARPEPAPAPKPAAFPKRASKPAAGKTVDGAKSSATASASSADNDSPASAAEDAPQKADKSQSPVAKSSEKKSAGAASKPKAKAESDSNPADDTDATPVASTSTSTDDNAPAAIVEKPKATDAKPMAAASTATDGEPQAEAIPTPITPEPLASNAPVAANAQTPATLATDAAAQPITVSLVAKVAAPTAIVSREATPTAPVGPEATAGQTAATDANLDQMVAKTLSTKTEEASATKPKAKTERAPAKTDPAADLLATIAASKDPAAAEPAAGTKAAESDARPTGDQAKQNKGDAQGQTSQSSQNPAALPVAPAAVGDFAKTAATPVQAAPVAGKVSDVAKTETLDSAQSAMPTAKTFANDAGLAPNALLSPAPTTAAEAAKFSAPNTLVRVPMTELGATVVRMAKSGENAFDLRLDPLDLGRVDVKVEIADNGRINATFVVERKETLEMLQRDQSQLQKAFDMAGLKTDAGSLSFSLKDQNNPGNQGTPREFRAFGRYDQSPDSADLGANDAPIISRPTSALRALDISV